MSLGRVAGTPYQLCGSEDTGRRTRAATVPKTGRPGSSLTSDERAIRNVASRLITAGRGGLGGGGRRSGAKRSEAGASSWFTLSLGGQSEPRCDHPGNAELAFPGGAGRDHLPERVCPLVQQMVLGDYSGNAELARAGGTDHFSERVCPPVVAGGCPGKAELVFAGGAARDFLSENMHCCTVYCYR
jgi:hypothetical protein